MSYTITDNLSPLFGTQEVSLVVDAFLATDFAGIPAQYMAPPSNAKVQATTTADSSGNFVLTLPLDSPVYLACHSVLSPTIWYWAIGRGVDVGTSAISGTVPSTGLAAASTQVLGNLAQYTAALGSATALSDTKYGAMQCDKYGRLLRGSESINILNHASAPDTGVASKATTTYDNTGSFYDVSSFDEVSIKWYISVTAGGSSPTLQMAVDLIDAQGAIFTAYTSDAIASDASGSFNTGRLISIGKGCTAAATSAVQGANSSLAGNKMRIRITGGGSTSNTSITYSLVVDGR